MDPRFLARARALAGFLLLGQGLLVVTRILDHEAPLPVGFGLVALGALLLLWPHREGARPPAAAPRPHATRANLVAVLGLTAAGGVGAYNLRQGSDLGTPEVAILLYGIALLVASRHLHRRVARTDVGTLVAYSFPLVLAPLSLYALNAALAAQASETPVRLYVRYLLVAPMASALHLLSLDVSLIGETVRLTTPRGPLFLTVGVVCAGLYASVLFMGVFALFAWQARTPPGRLAAYLALGLAGLHVANLVRLVLLALVGHRWGGVALQRFHEHAGWVLFILWALVYWALVLRRFEGPAREAPPNA